MFLVNLLDITLINILSSSPIIESNSSAIWYIIFIEYLMKHLILYRFFYQNQSCFPFSQKTRKIDDHLFFILLLNKANEQNYS